jgi:hypothetical protein
MKLKRHFSQGAGHAQRSRQILIFMIDISMYFYAKRHYVLWSPENSEAIINQTGQQGQQIEKRFQHV